MKDYREIKSDEEFVHGVRMKIHALQFEVNEAERVRVAKRESRLARAKFIASLGAVSIPYWFIVPRLLELQGSVYIWCFAMLLTGTVYENFIETRSDPGGNHRA